MLLSSHGRSELGFAAANVLVGGATLAVGIWGLPWRSPWTIVPCALVGLLLLSSSASLVSRFRRADLVSQVAASALLALGLLAILGVAIGTAFLRTTSGPLAADAVRLLAVTLSVALAYWVVYPLAFLLWLAKKRHWARTS